MGQRIPIEKIIEDFMGRDQSPWTGTGFLSLSMEVRKGRRQSSIWREWILPCVRRVLHISVQLEERAKRENLELLLQDCRLAFAPEALPNILSSGY